MLLASDGPRLIDFGISRALEGTAMTGTSMIVGTPAFMSPEQAEGFRVGPASEVFALGSAIAFAATGAVPFGASTSGPVAMACRVVHGQPDLSRVPAPLRDLVAACLAKNPVDRPQLTQLMDAVRDGSAPVLAVWPGDFWPEPVAGMVSSRQDSVHAQLLVSDRPGPGRSMPSWPHEPTTPAKVSPGYGGAGTTRTQHSAPATACRLRLADMR